MRADLVVENPEKNSSNVELKRPAGHLAISQQSGGRSQFATGSQKRRDPGFLPYAFTEHGVQPDDSEVLRSQFVTLKSGSGRHSKYLPYVFSEQGVATRSTVLRSKRAMALNIEIMRAFVRPVSNPMNDLNGATCPRPGRRERLNDWNDWNGIRDVKRKYDAQFKIVCDAIRELMTPLAPKRRRVGFLVSEKPARYGR